MDCVLWIDSSCFIVCKRHGSNTTTPLSEQPTACARCAPSRFPLTSLTSLRDLQQPAHRAAHVPLLLQVLGRHRVGKRSPTSCPLTFCSCNSMLSSYLSSSTLIVCTMLAAARRYWSSTLPWPLLLIRPSPRRQGSAAPLSSICVPRTVESAYDCEVSRRCTSCRSLSAALLFLSPAAPILRYTRCSLALLFHSIPACLMVHVDVPKPLRCLQQQGPALPSYCSIPLATP